MKLSDQARFTVLSKLSELSTMNMLEIGFSATPQLIRNMAARGLVKVDVTITNRGQEELGKERVRRARHKANSRKALNQIARGGF